MASQIDIVPEAADIERNIEPIAIVGIGCRVPGGANSARAYWDFLCAGKLGISEVPGDRWDGNLLYDTDPGKPGRTVTKWGGFVPELAAFDATFFGISPREAAAMDPQQRALLHVTWEALEDAGLPPEKLAGSRSAVFVGASINDYSQIQRFRDSEIDLHAGTGNAMAIIANRLSHRFDLRGPSVVVDTACSSSLVATDLAVRALLRDDCVVALAGGVNALFEPGPFINFSKANMMSPRGRCHTFDATADGYVRAEGAGVVVLKRLSQALADGDRIYALIHGTAVNQDGHTSTITVPSAESQAGMLRLAVARAGLTPRDVAFVEAHGTGTPVGDPIESHAIGSVFGQARLDQGGVVIGAGKTNTGHGESFAGILGLIKTALVVHHGQIPPNLNYSAPNPNIPFAKLGIELPLSLREYPSSPNGRFAAVNSFGFGGTNACAVLGEAPAAARPLAIAVKAPDGQPVLLPLSAATPAALKQSATRLADHLEANPDLALPAVAATLSLHRGQLQERLVADASDRGSLLRALRGFAADETTASATPGAPFAVGRAGGNLRPVFVFAGQGGQWWAMGRDLFASDPVYRATIEEFEAHFHAVAGWSIIDALHASEKKSQINRTLVTQPAIFALQAGLVARWRAWGVEPAAVLGHSFGEVGAAWTAGVLSLREAAHVIFHRARLSGETEGSGGILALGVTPSKARALMARHGTRRIEIAAVNGSEMVSLAGDRTELDQLAATLQREEPDLFCKPIRMAYAPHTSLMEPIHDALLVELEAVTPHPAQVPLISTVSGALLDGTLMGADYWWRNIRQPVLFKAAIDQALRLGHRSFLEIGPHSTLSGLVSGALAEGGGGSVVPSLVRGQPEQATLRGALAALVANGTEVDWKAINGPTDAREALPTYPWEYQRHWVSSEGWKRQFFQAPVHPLLGRRGSDSDPLWEGQIDIRQQTYLRDHAVGGSIIFPAAGYIEILLAAAAEIQGDGTIELEDLQYFEALVLEEERIEVVRTRYEPGRRRLQIFSRTLEGAPDWVLRASAKLGFNQPVAKRQAPLKAAAGSTLRNHSATYELTAAFGFNFGPAFQGIHKLWPDLPTTVGEVRRQPALAQGIADYYFHPAMLDACLQVGNGAVFRGLELELRGDARTYLPVRTARVRWFRRPGARVMASAEVTRLDEYAATFNYRMADAKGEPIFELEASTSKALGQTGSMNRTSGPRLGFYREAWIERPLEGKPAPAAPGSWLLLGSGGAVERALAKRLRAAGHQVGQPGEALLRADDKTAYLALLDQLATDEPKLTGIVMLAAADQPRHAPDVTSLMAEQDHLTAALVALGQALAEREALAPRLYVVTAGAQLVAAEEAQADTAGGSLVQAPISGMTRVLATEIPRLRATAIDLPAAPDRVTLKALGNEILDDGRELECALRASGRYVRRLEHVTKADLPPLQMGGPKSPLPEAWRLVMPAPGLIDDLRLEETAPSVPGPGEAVIAVKAVGLNFRDVMAATGLLPEEAESGQAWQSLGLECAGVVLAVGRGVKHVKRGDRVMTAAKGCFQSHLKLPAALLHRMPRTLGFVEAATISSAFMTAYHALVSLAHLRKGERVLIHMATGGVGLAAIEIARMLGAEVFATAGSPTKRDFLKKRGIKHIMDSRSLVFVDEVMEKTGGKGVDVVLNALAGAAIEGGLKVLAPFGRFCEIGKRDIYADSAIGLRLLRSNISFHAIDLAAMGEQRPEMSARLFGELAKLLAGKKIRPLPTDVFPIDRVADAFRHMAKAQHIGKIVVTLDTPPAQVDKSAALGPRVRDDGAYLVTGGLNGFGLEVARWLAARGAGCLVLMGRSGAATPVAKAAVAKLRRQGCKVVVVKGDVTGPDDCARAVGAAGDFTLRGVIHAAVVLDDAFITQLTRERLDQVLGPKMLGAWNLHQATAKLPLDFFVGFSSVAAVLGSTGQANYVAANSFIDAMMRWRRARGLPGQSIAWGALGGTGLVERNAGLQGYMQSMGIAPIPVVDAIEGMSLLMCRDLPVAAYLAIDWQALKRVAPDIGNAPRLAELVAAFSSGAVGGGRFRGELMAAAPAARPALLSRFLSEQVAKVLKIDAAGIELERPLADLGLDSLTSFELKNRVEAELALNLPVGRFLQRPTLAGLATSILEAIDSKQQSDAAATSGAATGPVRLPANVEMLWDLYGHGLQATAMADYFEHAFAVKVRLTLDETRLRNAFSEVTRRYSSLRSSFPAADGRPQRRVAGEHPIGLEVVDASGLDERAFDELLQARGQELLDIQNGPLVRLQLLRRGEQQDVLMLRASHSIVDGWSLALLLSELFGSYFGVRAVQEAQLSSEAMELEELGQWEAGFLDSEEGQRQLAHWQGVLAKPTAPYGRFNARRHPAGPLRDSDQRLIKLGQARSNAVKALARSRSTTPFAMLLAAAAVLYRDVLGRDDLLISSLVAARTRPETLGAMAWLANPLAMKLELSALRNFDALAEAAARQVRELLANQEVPAAALRQSLGAAADFLSEFGDFERCATAWQQIGFEARRPDNLEDAGFGQLMLNQAGTRVQVGELDVETLGLKRGTTMRDMNLRPNEVNGEIFLHFTFNRALFTPAEADAVGSRYLELLDRLLQDPKQALPQARGLLDIDTATLAAK